MADDQERRAIIITGPRWWGSVSTGRDAVQVNYTDEGEYRRRAAEAEAEERLLVDKIEKLPAGCLVMHGALAGAETLAGLAAQSRDLPVSVTPAFMCAGRAALSRRNEALLLMGAGLRSAGWTVRVLVLGPPEGETVVMPEVLAFVEAAARAEFEVFWGRAPVIVEEPPDEPGEAADEDGEEQAAAV